MYRCPCCGLYMKYYTDYDCAGNIVGFWHCQLCHYDTRNIQNTVTSTNDFNQIIASKVNSAESDEVNMTDEEMIRAMEEYLKTHTISELMEMVMYAVKDKESDS